MTHPSDDKFATLPRPSQLMRERHPDLFSDTQVESRPRLSRQVFEYHLETLTSRKQEYEFEDFCKRLAEKEICPNLRVQTGPTGGGDSKVDTETYPVSEDVSERWWAGDALAGSERWAFAFSAKRTWKSKVIADVKSILSTGRDYKRIYFFTNQFVSDRKRAAAEDELLKLSGLPVHIFDRSWIVEKVYEHDHLAMAMATLAIEGGDDIANVRRGPLDVGRQSELEKLDKRVADPTQYQGSKYQLIEDCLRIAILARGLERPRYEVEARFARASSLANELGYAQQQMRIAYNRAWTAHWWFEDFTLFNSFYDEVEQLLQGSQQAIEIEKLVTLWHLLNPAVRSGRMTQALARIEEREEVILNLLRPIADDGMRLNNALQAQTNIVFMGLWGSLSQGDSASADAAWQQLSTIIDKSDSLWGYPIERLSDWLRELGQSVDSSSFDALYEKAANAVAKRRSEGAAGESYAARARQKLDHGRPYDAIQWFGRAEELLVKDEYRSELIEVLLNSARAYENAGLFWAARSKLLVAAERSLVHFVEDGAVTVTALMAVNSLAWVELQLGRIMSALQAMSFASALVEAIGLPDDRRELYDEDVRTQEIALGILFDRLSFESLSVAGQLPSALDRLGLHTASLGLLFALGQNEYIRSEMGDATSDLEAMREKWLSQPLAEQLPAKPTLMESDSCILLSTILGSRISVEAPCDPVSLGLVESLLGALEALLATSNEDDLVPTVERTSIIARIEPEGSELGFALDESGCADFVITRPSDFEVADRAAMDTYRVWLESAVITLLSSIFAIRNVGTWMEAKAGGERAFSRALLLGDAWGLARNVFGETPKVRLADWIEAVDPNFDCLREESGGQRPTDDAAHRHPLKWGSGEPPNELLDSSRLKHSDRQILSPIVGRLWDEARWRGTLFAQFPGGPPILGLLFENPNAGEAIFKGWRDRWGEEDMDDALRVAIVRGISAKSPAHYSVVVGPNLAESSLSQSKIIVTVSRLNKMEPTSTENLDRFLVDYGNFGGFFLIPAKMDLSSPELLTQYALAKRHLHVKSAWEIGENDPDQVVFRHIDDPVIPADVEDPPIRRALEAMKRMGSRSK
jgi:hypothetical protein